MKRSGITLCFEKWTSPDGLPYCCNWVIPKSLPMVDMLHVYGVQAHNRIGASLRGGVWLSCVIGRCIIDDEWESRDRHNSLASWCAINGVHGGEYFECRMHLYDEWDECCFGPPLCTLIRLKTGPSKLWTKWNYWWTMPRSWFEPATQWLDRKYKACPLTSETDLSPRTIVFAVCSEHGPI